MTQRPAWMPEYLKLKKAWDTALAEYNGGDCEEYASATEQRTFDALVDFVEANDLNYSKYDPRDIPAHLQ